MYICMHAYKTNYQPHHSCSAMCYQIVSIKITLNMHASTILTCMQPHSHTNVWTYVWSQCKHICACIHYNPLARFVPTTYNTNWQKGGNEQALYILHWSGLCILVLGVLKWCISEVQWHIWIMEFFRRNTYFVHVLNYTVTSAGSICMHHT